MKPPSLDLPSSELLPTARHSSLLRRIAIALLVFLPAAVAVLASIEHQGEWFLVATFWGFVALVYWLGFFRCMPEILGGRALSEPLVLRFQRWLRWSGLIALAVGALLLVNGGLFFLLPGIPIVYLAVVFLMGFQDTVTSGLPSAPAEPSKMERLWINLGRPVRAFWHRLSVRIGIGAGSVLVLSSLFLITSMSYGCSTGKYRGYQVVTGEARWVTAQNMNSDSLVGNTTKWAGWTMYLAGLLAAGIGLVASVRKGKPTAGLAASRFLLWVSGLAAVFTISDLGMYWVHNFWFVPQSVFWGLPLVLCVRYLVRSRKGRSNPEEILHLKLGLLILYFPLVMVSYGTVAVIATPPIAWGYLAYFVGIQLLWVCAMKAQTSQPMPSPTAFANAVASS